MVDQRPPPQPSRRTWLTGAAIVFAVLGFALLQRQVPHVPTGLEGTTAPDFTLPAVTADRAAAAHILGPKQSRGRPLLVHFWAPSCAPCVADLPRWQKLWQARDPSQPNFDLLTVAGDDLPQVRGFLAARGFTLPVLHDEDGRAHRSYRVIGIPMTFAVDAQGAVVREWQGPVDPREALAALE
jgi:peroxiredoxin